MKIHHLTHINNLENILMYGLKSRNFLNKASIEFEDTAEIGIIKKREKLNNCIPFHIDEIQEKHGVPYNFTVCKVHSPENMVFLLTDTSKLPQEKIQYLLGHPASNDYSMYSDEKEFVDNFNKRYEKIVEIYEGRFPYNEQDVKSLLMSEVLLDFEEISLNLSDWDFIVFSEVAKRRVDKILNEYFVEKKAIIDENKFFKGFYKRR